MWSVLVAKARNLIQAFPVAGSMGCVDSEGRLSSPAERMGVPLSHRGGFPGGSVVKKKTRLPMQETRVRSLGREDPLEEEMATHSSTFAWEMPWTEEPCELQSMESPKSLTRLSD